jgi:polysaccharide export outer membrane protein
MIRTRAGKLPYELVPIDARVIQTINRMSPAAGHNAAGGRQSDRLFAPRGIEQLSTPVRNSILPGDVVSVAIFETDTALFRPSLAAGTLAVSPMTALPPQVVDQTGEISVPFIGRVKALGRLPVDIENEIKNGLKLKTADPQVLVTVADRKGGDLVSIAGDVRQPAQIPVAVGGTRLVDAIARVGGSPSAPHDTMVTVSRGGMARSEPLQDVFDNPQKNIQLQPGDTVILRKRALSFKAFGSTGRVGSYPIPQEDLSLADALAASGGPADLQANPTAIFLYREEPVALLSALGRNPVGNGPTAHVIYQLNLANPQGFFFADKFTVRDRDVLYYASSGSAGFQKFMALLNTLLSPAYGAAGAAASVTILSAP